MAQTHQAVKLSPADVVGYTPGSLTGAGDVVVQGTMAGVSTQPIAASALGSLTINGRFKMVKVTGAISAGAAVYWDATGNPLGGTAGSGAVTTTAAGNTFLGVASAAGADASETVEVRVFAVPITLQGVLQNVITDPGDAGAIPVVASGSCMLVSAGAEARTIGTPTFVGQQLNICVQTHVGVITITVASTYNVANNNTLISSAVGESCLLTSVNESGSLVWRLTHNDGWALSTA